MKNFPRGEVKQDRREKYCGQSIQRQNLLPKSQGFTVQNKILTLYNERRGQETAV